MNQLHDNRSPSMNPPKIHIVISSGLSDEQRKQIEQAAQKFGASVVDTQARVGSPGLAGQALRDEQVAAASAVKNALDIYEAALNAPRVLSDEERQLLISGIAQERHTWEQGWIGDIVGNGYFGWHSHPDVLIIEDAFVTNFCLGSVEDTSDKVALLRVMARPEIFAILSQRFIELGENEAMLDDVIDAVEQAARSKKLKPGSPESEETHALAEMIVKQLEELQDNLAQGESAPSPI